MAMAVAATLTVLPTQAVADDHVDLSSSGMREEEQQEQQQQQQQQHEEEGERERERAGWDDISLSAPAPPLSPASLALLLPSTPPPSTPSTLRAKDSPPRRNIRKNTTTRTKSAQSLPDRTTRAQPKRTSLSLPFLTPQLFSANNPHTNNPLGNRTNDDKNKSISGPTAPSLLATTDAQSAHSQPFLSSAEASVAHRIAALRELNGATRSRGRNIASDRSSSASGTRTKQGSGNSEQKGLGRGEGQHQQHQHRYAKSAGARNSTFNQPVIVRTYSGRRPSQSYAASSERTSPTTTSFGPFGPFSSRSHLDADDTSRPYNTFFSRLLPGATSNDPSTSSTNNLFRPHSRRAHSRTSSLRSRASHVMNMGRAELPPVEAFSFKGIMSSIQSGVTDDLERIAEICARSRYSLSNQYEVHMPPHGDGDPFALGPSSSGGRGAGGIAGAGAGLTLEAVTSDDEHGGLRSNGSSINGSSSTAAYRSSAAQRGARVRTKSRAYGTLETIYSSSKSSEEDKTKKKAAKVLAEEVRGRASRKVEPGRSLPLPQSVPVVGEGVGGISGNSGGGIEAYREARNHGPSKALRRHGRSVSAGVVALLGGAGAVENSSGTLFSTAPSSSALISRPAMAQTSVSGSATAQVMSISALASSSSPYVHGVEPEPEPEITTVGQVTSGSIGTVGEGGELDVPAPEEQEGAGEERGEEADAGKSALGLFAGQWASWIPWGSGRTAAGIRDGGISKSDTADGKSRARTCESAEDKLRELLARGGGSSGGRLNGSAKRTVVRSVVEPIGEVEGELGLDEG